MAGTPPKGTARPAKQAPKPAKTTSRPSRQAKARQETPAPTGLQADLAAVKDLFSPKARRTVTLPLPLSARNAIAAARQGLSAFLEAAITTCTAHEAAIWRAAHGFCTARRAGTGEDPVENASARLSDEAFERVEALGELLKTHNVQGVTRARVLSGFLALHLEQTRTARKKGR